MAEHDRHNDRRHTVLDDLRLLAAGPVRYRRGDLLTRNGNDAYAEIDLGDPIEVTGVMAHTKTCLGPVLYAEEVRQVERIDATSR